MIKVMKSEHGRGVFATQIIPKGTVVEVCPVLLIPEEPVETYLGYQLNRYAFSWTKSLGAIALGNGSLYNHSDSPNVSPLPSYWDDTIIFVAIHDIQPGHEICFDYGYSLKETHQEVEMFIDGLKEEETNRLKAVNQIRIDGFIENLKCSND